VCPAALAEARGQAGPAPAPASAAAPAKPPNLADPAALLKSLLK